MDIIALASDHRGFDTKTKLGDLLREIGHMPLDVGTHDTERCDAQDFAVAAALALRDGKAKKAIILCGSGNMIAMAANRFSHVRAAVCPHVTAARMARLHNDANVISIACDFMGYDLIKECVEAFLTTEFLGGRYGDRIHKLTKLDPSKL
jgi:ribose 5-phosphate isomerase B